MHNHPLRPHQHPPKPQKTKATTKTWRVLKFGGTSVRDTHNIRATAALVEDALQRADRLAVVVSALSGITDELAAIASSTNRGRALETLHTRHLEVARQLSDVPASRSVESLLEELERTVQDLPEAGTKITGQQRDEIVSFGERLSSPLVAAALRERGLKAEACDMRPLVRTKDGLGVTRVDHQTTFTALERHFVATKKILVATGFVASNKDGTTTTLGRGGSDLTAALLGAALNAEEIEIWTDVDGVLSADPRIVDDAFSIPELSYEEIMELAHFGAKVLYPPSVNPARDRSIPLRIRNTMRPEFPGTLISGRPITVHARTFTGITAVPNVTLLTLGGSGMVGVTGTAHRFFGALAGAACNVILISQASSEHTICCAVDPEHAQRAQTAVDLEFEKERKAHRIRPLRLETDLSVVAVIGEGMRERPGIAASVFSVLGKHNLNVRAIAQGSSERNISMVIARQERSLAVRILHAELLRAPSLEESLTPQEILPLDIVVAGIGGVGAELVKLVLGDPERMRLVGVLNSTHQLLQSGSVPKNDPPLDTAGWRKLLAEEGAPVQPQRLARELPASCAFVDCTASPEVADLYPGLLAQGVSVVAANKIGLAADRAKRDSTIDNPNSLNDLDRLDWCRRGSLYRPSLGHSPGPRPAPRISFEATVGAGLPVVSTLESLLDSGDQILEISGVFSGTLGFLLAQLRSGTAQSKAVRQAYDQGLTEPDPRDDLSGVDVARKLLILSRLCGCHLDLNEINIQPFLTLDPNATLEEFWATLPSKDASMSQALSQASERGETLAYLAQATFQDYPEGKPRLTVGLQRVSREHPAGQLKGTDNLFLFRTERYRDQPLVITGPGAGTVVTAAGVFGDLLALHRGMQEHIQEPTPRPLS